MYINNFVYISFILCMSKHPYEVINNNVKYNDIRYMSGLCMSKNLIWLILQKNEYL